MCHIPWLRSGLQVMGDPHSSTAEKWFASLPWKVYGGCLHACVAYDHLRMCLLRMPLWVAYVGERRGGSDSMKRMKVEPTYPLYRWTQPLMCSALLSRVEISDRRILMPDWEWKMSAAFLKQHKLGFIFVKWLSFRDVILSDCYVFSACQNSFSNTVLPHLHLHSTMQATSRVCGRVWIFANIH
jgi:hypothetical protein